jgi:hypothetical protein
MNSIIPDVGPAFQRWSCGTCKDWGTLEDTDALCPEGCAASERVATARGTAKDRPVVHGPYETSVEALRDAEPLRQAIRRADPGFGPMTDAIRAARKQARVDYLTSALTAAGVVLGAYDRRTAVWLADMDPETVQVVVGWVERAHAAGRDGAR